MSIVANSASESDGSEGSENTFCVFLHVVEGIGLCPREGIGDSDGDWNKGKVILNASLNGVKFEVEGHSTESTTIFNSNCIWECELDDIKRMKTDNRPVKLEIFQRPGRTENAPRKLIGSLLLPIRGLQTVSTLRNMQFKMHWHKLGAISSEWRQNKPEIYLLLTVVKKTLIDNGQFEEFMGKKKHITNDLLSPHVSETASMLQSKSNIYVQLLEQVGLIQVGNNPDVDCDIFNVALTFKQVKDLIQLLERDRRFINNQSQAFVFTYDFLGSASNLEIFVNKCDCYTINEKITLSFKSSLRSLRDYFQRIFYVPINLYLNGVAIANYRLDFSKFLPDDGFFNSQNLWIKNGNFHFDRLHKILSPNAQKPSVDFIFSVQLITSNAKKNNIECTVNETFTDIACDSKLPANFTDYYNMEANSGQKHLTNADNVSLNSCNLNNLELFDKNCNQSRNESFLVENEIDHPFEKESKQKIIDQTTPNQISTISTETVLNDDKIKTYASVCIGTEEMEALANDTEDVTLKIVQELEEWKEQQMEHFIAELERKEVEYLSTLHQQWELERSNLQQKLETKIIQCEELNARLERSYNELKSNTEQKKMNVEIAETIKNDIQKSYANKFIALETEIKRLQTEMHQKGTQIENQKIELQIENNKLETERMNLKASIEILETQLSELNRTHLSANELKRVLSDLRLQTEHFTEVEKSKNYYKEQWAKTTRDLHKLKLEMLSQHDYSSKNETDNFGICLKEIFTEEQDALNSDRSDLRSIKEALFTSDTSSTCDFEDDA